ncbi:dethiobiotin synthase [Marmoricola sp. URHB0036]|uniref:dethiobiotin synthase n=1 Tax=Marmoricola sp. URHB0036 TaxID=1298863 RepID=UPI0003FA8A50|nr:dethiobiotin synthase [Marmoricola sp. URHB0036]
MSVLFVTGTDTEVGKTVVTAALAAVQLSLGRTVAVVKPAQTGIGPDEDGDLAEVRRLAGDVATYEGVRLPDPLAPDTAARVAGLELPGLAEQRGLVDRVAAAHGVTLVEGAGGVLVNLGENWNLIDLADSVRYAGHQVVFVVVARAGLGTLNHAALTVQAIQARALEVAGVVVGAWPAEPGLAEEQNLLDLPRVTGVPLIGRVPEGAAALPVRAFRRGALDWVPDL